MIPGKSFAIALAATLAATASGLHYEKPPCGSDEKAVQLMGIDGIFCSPMCDPGCPTDAPDGVTATPQCALQSPDGEKYCAILCEPKNEDALGGGDCGDVMNCEPIPQSGGLGICVYSMASGLRAAETTTVVLGVASTELTIE